MLAHGCDHNSRAACHVRASGPGRWAGARSLALPRSLASALRPTAVYFLPPAHALGREKRPGVLFFSRAKHARESKHGGCAFNFILKFKFILWSRSCLPRSRPLPSLFQPQSPVRPENTQPKIQLGWGTQGEAGPQKKAKARQAQAQPKKKAKGRARWLLPSLSDSVRSLAPAPWLAGASSWE
jgi:hypothetical protein